MHEHPSLPADDIWERGMDVIVLIIELALNQRNHGFGDWQEEHCHEIRCDLIENLQRPRDSEFLLLERVRHVHDIQDNQQNDEH